MVQVSVHEDRLIDSNGNRYFNCHNQIEHGNCNWLRAEQDGPGYCLSCQHTRMIPNLDYADNLIRWSKLEQEKKRLLFAFLTLGIAPSPGELMFDFLEDARTNPTTYGGEIHNTGYANGVVTINVAEADDVVREQERHAVNEQYRTVLGHFRHESGHYFFERIPTALKDPVTSLFGDAQADYNTALADYYANGPGSNWQDTHISAYASAHPLEDWAETWSHYLHMHDVIETAVAYGLQPARIEGASIEEKISAWRELSVILNELNRSIGLGDAYPFVLGAVVTQKLALIERVVTELRNPQAIPASA